MRKDIEDEYIKGNFARTENGVQPQYWRIEGEFMKTEEKDHPD